MKEEGITRGVPGHFILLTLFLLASILRLRLRWFGERLSPKEPSKKQAGFFFRLNGRVLVVAGADGNEKAVPYVRVEDDLVKSFVGIVRKA